MPMEIGVKLAFFLRKKQYLASQSGEVFASFEIFSTQGPKEPLGFGKEIHSIVQGLGGLVLLMNSFGANLNRYEKYNLQKIEQL